MNLSSYLPKLQIANDKVFDPVRKKWLTIQPEELVRQALILHLIQEIKLPISRLSVEKAIRLHQQVRRFDIVYYDRQGHPLLLVECKSPSVSINDQVLEQAVWYNFEIKAPYLLLSNGKKSTYYRVDTKNKTYQKIQGLDGLDL